MDLPINILPAAWGAIRLDPELASAKIGERILTLTPTEFRFLHALVSGGGTVTYAELIKSVFGMKYEGWRHNLRVVNSVRVVVSRLRKKLPEISIVNDQWQGYHIELKKE